MRNKLFYIFLVVAVIIFILVSISIFAVSKTRNNIYYSYDKDNYEWLVKARVLEILSAYHDIGLVSNKMLKPYLLTI